ncbi:twin-arginine translocase subunit TatC [Halomarina litorea]|uniref:twin-arginine translocase subunit TatC n=1 Tax=Halomarina litorea TaxID=2961595 RepID=UPI0020C4A4B3|nr:twin-arginine translocase subunit TatC [Halomarina sp. BCD28]
MAVLDDDSKAALASGRDTLRGLWGAARANLQRVFVAFLVGFLGSFYLLQWFVWDRLQADLFARLPPAVREATSVIALTPFDVILLQAKIGMAAGTLLAVPVVLYYARESLAARGLWPDLPRRTIAAVAVLAVALFVGGIAYSYLLFFPLMFSFLTSYSVQVGFSPTYSIVSWAEFVFVLSLSFGLAAELPLAILGLSLTEIVPYRTFRERWRYAVVGIFVFGAVFSPPDPFTQIMWAVPLLILYALSLALTRAVLALRGGRDRVSLRGALRASAPRNVAVAGVVSTALVGALAVGAGRAVYRGLADPRLPVSPGPLPPVESLVGLPRPAALTALGVAVFVVVLVAGSALSLYRAAVAPPAETSDDAGGARGPFPVPLDLATLPVEGLLVAPTALFAALTDEAALSYARGAMAAGEGERARVLLARFDDARAATETAARAERDRAARTREAGGPDEEGTDLVASVRRTAADMATAFRDEEVTEDDLGGYLYDLQFVVESLTSRTFRIVATFIGVLAVTFVAFYQGGVEAVKNDFLARLPASVAPGDIDIVELHPVETLVFGVKLSTLLAAIVTLPVVLYYAWPALKARGLAGGDRRVLLVWGGALLAGLAGGVTVGYAVVAPTVISWLAADVVRAEMLVSYRINAFGWLVFLTTVGVGLLATVPVTMLLFHFGGIVRYRPMRRRWREVTVLVLVLASGLMSGGVFTMFLLTVPTMVAYGVGLGVLWVVTLGGRTGQERSLGRPDGAGESER